MNILALSVRVPEEGKKGDQTLSYHRLRYLSDNHKITLICFGSHESDSMPLAKLESLGITVKVIRWNKITAAKNLLLALFCADAPFQCALFQSGPYRKAVMHSVAEFHPDAVYAVMIRPLMNLPGSCLPLFVDMIDSMGLHLYRRVALERGWRRIVVEMERRRVGAYEVKVISKAVCAFVVSRIDQKFIAQKKVQVLPIGIDNREFFKRPDGSLEPVIAFTGNMNYKPNVDAVLWFYRHCWKKLKFVIPGLRWVIAGSNPLANVVCLRSDSAITVTGRVVSLAAVLNAARLAIAPMQSGSGMQFKILEAMACGVPVVTTSLGLGDIAAKPDQEVILAESADEFVQAVINLLASADLRRSIGEAGMRYVRAHHTWDTLNAQFEKSMLAALN